MGRKRSVCNGLELGPPQAAGALVETIWSAISLNPDPLVRGRKFGRSGVPLEHAGSADRGLPGRLGLVGVVG